MGCGGVYVFDSLIASPGRLLWNTTGWWAYPRWMRWRIWEMQIGALKAITELHALLTTVPLRLAPIENQILARKPVRISEFNSSWSVMLRGQY